MSIAIEVIAVTPRDAVAAQEGGADRLELIANPLEGGTTPSAGVIRAVKGAVDIPVFVMIRPRGGHFVYTPPEVEAMVEDAAIAAERGADGVVTGALSEDGAVDVETVARVIAAANLPAIFHRAFDQALNMRAALATLSKLRGVERILTSGGAKSVDRGREVIRRLVGQRAVEIMPGGGVTVENVHELIAYTGARAVHVGSAVREPQEATAPVSTERVRRLRDRLKGL